MGIQNWWSGSPSTTSSSSCVLASELPLCPPLFLGDFCFCCRWEQIITWEKRVGAKIETLSLKKFLWAQEPVMAILTSILEEVMLAAFEGSTLQILFYIISAPTTKGIRPLYPASLFPLMSTLCSWRLQVQASVRTLWLPIITLQSFKIFRWYVVYFCRGKWRTDFVLPK